MKHPKFLVEDLLKTSKRFFKKNASGVEVFMKTYLRFLTKTYFMEQGSGGSEHGKEKDVAVDRNGRHKRGYVLRVASSLVSG